MRFVVVAVVLLTFCAGLVWLLQRRLIYFPSGDVPEVELALPGAEEVTFRTDDGLLLEGWFLPADARLVTVVVFSGNAGNRGDRAEFGRALGDNGYGVLLFDYRGYGGSPGQPSEEGLIADGVAALRYLSKRVDVEADKLVYFGESLGAGVAVATAGSHPPAALVLRSPFTSLSDVAGVHYPYLPTGIMLWDEYPNLETIPKVHAPLLVIAGSTDRTVPVEQSVRLYDAANEPKELLLVRGADHNDHELRSGPEIVGSVVEFIEAAMSGMSSGG
jgi:fermentation-respiration switch protein FrsA (DUF1100 family)